MACQEVSIIDEKNKRKDNINGPKSINTLLVMILFLYYSLMNCFSKRIITVIRSSYSNINLRKKSIHRRIFKAKKSAELSHMVWKCFISDKLSPLVFINSTVN